MSWLDDFARDRFSEPFTALDVVGIARVRAAAEAALERDGPDARSRAQSRHLDDPVLREFCESPAIVSRVRAILGDDVVLWRSNLFPKPPGASEFEWHRDSDHWTTMLDPMRNVTAWVALEPAHAENGCLEFRSPADPERTIVMELPAGGCVLFDQDAVHRSGANPTRQGRLALAIRYTLPHVRIDRTRLFPAYRTIALAP